VTTINASMGRRIRAAIAATWSVLACGRSGRPPVLTRTPRQGLNGMRRSSTASCSTIDSTVITSAVDRGASFFFRSRMRVFTWWRRIATSCR
jgi:hypothetical protein